MAQQTAVEWYYRELKSLHDACYDTNEAVDILYEQAKQMEKEQRIKDYNVGYLDAKCNHINDAENYVNEQDYLNSDSTV